MVFDAKHTCTQQVLAFLSTQIFLKTKSCAPCCEICKLINYNAIRCISFTGIQNEISQLKMKIQIPDLSSVLACAKTGAVLLICFAEKPAVYRQEILLVFDVPVTHLIYTDHMVVFPTILCMGFFSFLFFLLFSRISY